MPLSHRVTRARARLVYCRTPSPLAYRGGAPALPSRAPCVLSPGGRGPCSRLRSSLPSRISLSRLRRRLAPPMRAVLAHSCTSASCRQVGFRPPDTQLYRSRYTDQGNQAAQSCFPRRQDRNRNGYRQLWALPCPHSLATPVVTTALWSSSGMRTEAMRARVCQSQCSSRCTLPPTSSPVPHPPHFTSPPPPGRRDRQSYLRPSRTPLSPEAPTNGLGRRRWLCVSAESFTPLLPHDSCVYRIQNMASPHKADPTPPSPPLLQTEAARLLTSLRCPCGSHWRRWAFR